MKMCDKCGMFYEDSASNCPYCYKEENTEKPDEKSINTGEAKSENIAPGGEAAGEGSNSNNYIKKCGVCGFEIKSGEKYCPNCMSPVDVNNDSEAKNENVSPNVGTESEDSNSNNCVKKCGICGTEIKQGEKYCPNCMSPVEINANNKSKKTKSHNTSNQKFKLNINSPEDKKRLVIISILVAVVIIIGVALAIVLHSASSKSSDSYDDYDYSYSDIDTTKHEEDVDETYATTTTEVSIPSMIDSFSEAKIQNIVDTSGLKNVSVSIIDTDSNETINVSSNDNTIASAMVIYPVIYSYMSEINQGSISSQDQIQLKYSSSGRGYFIKNDAGKYYTIDELFKYALAYSDNNAINTLISNLGFNAITECCNNAGYSSVTVEKMIGVTSKNKENYISSKDTVNMIYEIQEDIFGQTVLNYISDTVNDSNGNIGMANKISSSVSSFNAYNQTVYNEVVRFKNEDGKEGYVVFYSESNTYTNGAKIAERIGEYINQCIN